MLAIVLAVLGGGAVAIAILPESTSGLLYLLSEVLIASSSCPASLHP